MNLLYTLIIFKINEIKKYSIKLGFYSLKIKTPPFLREFKAFIKAKGQLRNKAKNEIELVCLT